jgi:hypothetical protein
MAEENGEGRLFIKNPLNVQKTTQTLNAVSLVTTQIQTKTIHLTCILVNFSTRQLCHGSYMSLGEKMEGDV